MLAQGRTNLVFLCIMPIVQGFSLARSAPMRVSSRPAASIVRNVVRNDVRAGVMMNMLTKNGKATSATTITEDEVYAAQRKWADTIVAITNCYTEGGNHVKMATEAASDLYAFGHVDTILFKPTRCAEVQFRPKPVDALSYFVGGIHEEDTGFALGWKNVRFVNHAVDVHLDSAIAMGNYFFTDVKTDAISKVEYTFGYRKYKGGEVRIFLHHSSVPFAGAKTADKPGITVSADKSGGKVISLNIHL